MIDNLPKKFSIAQLQKFNFGDIEANDDSLLFDSVCQTSSIHEFLNGSKNIILGEKGTGKTALFRLIKEEKLKFKPKNGFKNLIIPIDDNFQYKSIKGKLLNLINSNDEEISFKYQVVWELFLFHKILQKLNKLELPKSIQKAIEISDKIFSNKGFDEFLKSKKSFGVKLYNTDTNILPDLYFSSEPVIVETNYKELALEHLELDLDFYKNEINTFLLKNEYNVIIIIDRLDEFVSKSELNVQLQMLEALISVEREYSRFTNIEIKIFLRDDLFKQLSFEGIGYDKIINKKIDLIWTPEKIREFIAKRICSNYKNVFNLTHLYVSLDEELSEIDTSIETIDYVMPNLCTRWYRKIIKKINPQHYAQKFPRKINLNDRYYKNIILSIFPRYVDFKNEDGKIVDIDIFDYLSKNFNLGTGNSIPRLILIFLQKTVSVASNYYIENPDQLPIYLNDQQCFELFKKGFFEKAYSEFKDEIYINFSKLNPEFEDKIMLFKEKIGNRYTFRAKDLKGLLNFKDNEELFHFCDYLIHIGFIKRTNTTSLIEEMKFELPIIFRIIK